MIEGNENYNTAVKGFIAAVVLFVVAACAFWCGLGVGCCGGLSVTGRGVVLWRAQRDGAWGSTVAGSA